MKHADGHVSLLRVHFVHFVKERIQCSLSSANKLEYATCWLPRVHIRNFKATVQ